MGASRFWGRCSALLGLCVAMLLAGGVRAAESAYMIHHVPGSGNPGQEGGLWSARVHAAGPADAAVTRVEARIRVTTWAVANPGNPVPLACVVNPAGIVGLTNPTVTPAGPGQFIIQGFIPAPAGINHLFTFTAQTTGTANEVVGVELLPMAGFIGFDSGNQGVVTRVDSRLMEEIRCGSCATQVEPYDPHNVRVWFFCCEFQAWAGDFDIPEGCGPLQFSWEMVTAFQHLNTHLGTGEFAPSNSVILNFCPEGDQEIQKGARFLIQLTVTTADGRQIVLNRVYVHDCDEEEGEGFINTATQVQKDVPVSSVGDTTLMVFFPASAASIRIDLPGSALDGDTRMTVLYGDLSAERLASGDPTVHLDSTPGAVVRGPVARIVLQNGQTALHTPARITFTYRDLDGNGAPNESGGLGASELAVGHYDPNAFLWVEEDEDEDSEETPTQVSVSASVSSFSFFAPISPLHAPVSDWMLYGE